MIGIRTPVGAAVLACLAAPLAADETAAELKPAPDYFIAAVVATTTAEQIIRTCPDFTIDRAAVMQLSEETLTRLISDGYDVAQPGGGMTDPGPQVEALQRAFLARHGLSGVITTDLVCEAGRVERAEASLIGQLLAEAPE